MAQTNVQVFSGTVTATNLIRGVAEEAVRWNSQSETVFPQSATTRYYKIATLGPTGEFANGGKLRISGTIGGFGENSTTLIDAFVASRGAAIKFGGTLSGYGGDPTGVVDIVVYLESNGTFGVWLKLLRYYTFDFTLLGAQVSNNTRTLAVLPCPTTDTGVATPTGTLEGSVVSACSVVFTTNGTLKQIGAGLNNNYIKLMKYFASGSNWKIATGSYLGASYQWLSIRAKMTRLDVDVETIQFNYYGNGGISRVRDSIVIGGGGAATQANEIKVYNKTSNSTYEIYLQIDSATSVEVEITHRGSTIDDDYSTVATANNGAIDETGLTKIYDSGTTTDLRLRSGNVGIGTNNPGAPLEIYTPTTGNSSTLVLKRDVSSYGGSDDGAAIEFKTRFSGNGATYGQVRIRGVDDNLGDSGEGGFAFDTLQDQVYYERMRIKHNGYVGIGVGAPQSALTVYNSSGIHITPTYTTNYTQTSQLDFNYGGGTDAGTLSSVRLKCVAVNRDGGAGPNYDYGAQGKLIFQGKTNNLFSGSASHKTYTDIMTVDGSIHNVGIGTTNPNQGKLEISVATTGTALYLRSNDYGQNYGTCNLRIGSGGSSNGPAHHAMITGGHTTNGSSYLSFSTITDVATNGYSPAERMRIDRFGNVGVGRTNPLAPLDVKARKGILTAASINDLYSNATIMITGTAENADALCIGMLGTDYGGNSGNNPYAYIQNIWDKTANPLAQPILLNPVGGNIGIGTTSPGYKLDVYGIMRCTDRIIANGGIDLPTNYGYNAILVGTGDSASYTHHNIRLRTWWSFGVRDHTDTCRILFDARTGSVLGTGTVGSTSDDRLKINEKRITRATDTILKLDPQLYHKTNKSSILPKEGEGVMYQTESGLIAQDIWYDAPELRHLVLLGTGADPAIEKPYRNPDITIDPDYSGWGPEPATVNYIGLIPYLIKSVQEITTELPNVKTDVSNVNVSNVDNYHGLIVSANKPDVYISTSSYDTKCYGVVSEENVETINNEILINTSRDGKVWVIDVENLQSGDYITTSNVAGYGMKQSDDLVHNYTVAKILQDCDFNPTQVPIKRVMRETRDVTYYVRREYSDVPQDGSEAHIHDNKIVEIDEVYYTKSTLVQVEANKDYTSRTFTPEITEEAYDALDESDRESYAVTYFNTEISEIRLEEYESLSTSEKEEYEQKTRRVRKILTLKEMKEPVPGHEMETRTEEVDVLDSNGQLVWEETGETRASYIIKYIDGAGVETDEANAVHRAALVNCKVVL